ncbi:AraC family transcriptional regulator [Rhodanobacter sp. FDAARGOS 1247]|jgi:PAS domain S-box-containing protein|uniref:AraC family transcriptional regulator n=1 Tax=Rhodanobacter sp. FDAARGOS 1247 TaxID=2778082 RepID=UPI00194EECCE|nr:AraC family transcriptional regulator [Rhodanobacter sp. FDAARGOS 1247]QRP63461.1 AraC family transcriptional regulator [Rhodanobacter sp. FDAARGOS 1247]
MDMKISACELQGLFDALPDVVFFVKDSSGRYTHANLTLVRRLGLKRRDEVVGRHVTEVFPRALGPSYALQDRRALSGETIENQLEVHILPNRAPGWCLTCKYPLRQRGEVCGVIGISRDLSKPDGRHPTYPRLIRVIEFMQLHFAESVRVSSLAELAEVSVAQLERHFRRVFQLTPQQALTKLRIESAMRLLQGTSSVADIGLACGFTDQSAFARQFKATVGMTPRDFRNLQPGSKP